MRVGLNLLHALPEIGGAWNYIAGLLAGLAECDSENQYVGFVTPESRLLLPSGRNFAAVELAIQSKSRPRRILYENTSLLGLTRKHRVDLVHWFANTQGLFNSVPAAVTFYDLMVFATPQAFSLPKRVYLQAMMKQTGRRAAMLLPMSNATAADMQRILHADPQRMSVIPPILDARFSVADETSIVALKRKYSFPDNFWLYVAHFYPHKNHLRLLEAYHALKRDGAAPWPLILCGDLKGSDEMILGAIRERSLERDVILISAGAPKASPYPRLSGDELPVLYSAAQAQVFPSLFEGAGIPLLEAMACGCPLLASGIPSVLEFAGDAAIVFNANSLAEMTEGMRRFQQDSALRANCRSKGLARVMEFRAGPVSRRLLAAYQKVLTPQTTW